MQDKEGKEEEQATEQDTTAGGSSVLATIRSRDFLIGLVGWFLVNGLLWFMIGNGSFRPSDAETGATMAAICAFPANVGVLLFLTIKKNTRRLAGGMLTAIAINLVIALIIGLSFNATCFVPFFVNTGA